MNGPSATWWLPFHSLPLFPEILFSVAFLIILAMLIWTGILFVRGLRADHEAAETGSDEQFEWVFLVPALNEEVTIADSIERLSQIDVERKRIVVINDGSEDRTGEILASLEDPDLTVIERRPPNARQGKAAALNHAYAEINRNLPLDPDSTIICIVDADGRITPDSPGFVAHHFLDPQVGGVQSLVRIYNRHRGLTWFQDLEFSIYGHLFQAGRNRWGTAGMGGNGQYNRLSALASIDTSKEETDSSGREADSGGQPPPGGEELKVRSLGPWRDRLTEDQDLGLRLILAGWRSHQENRAQVDQQGLPGLRPLFRQRTRWSQGNLQAMGLVGPISRSDLHLPARFELVVYLLMPILQGIVGLSLLVAVVLALGGTSIVSGSFWWLLFIYVLGFGGTVMGCLSARFSTEPDLAGLGKGLLSAQVYAFYSWLLWPVLLRSTARQTIGRDGWVKTAREKI